MSYKSLYQYYSSGEHKRQNYESYKNYDFSDQIVPRYEKEDKLFQKSKENIEKLSLKNQKNQLIEYIKNEEDRLLHLDVNSLRNLHKSRYGADVTQRLNNPQLYYEYDTTFRTTRQQMYEDKLYNEVKESFCDKNTDYIYLWKNQQPLANTKNSKIIEKDKNKQQENEEGEYFPHKKIHRGYKVVQDFMHQNDKKQQNNNKLLNKDTEVDKENQDIQNQDDNKSISQGIDDKSVGDLQDSKVHQIRETLQTKNSMVMSQQEQEILDQFKIPDSKNPQNNQKNQYGTMERQDTFGVQQDNQNNQDLSISKEMAEYKKNKQQLKQQQQQDSNRKGSKAKFLNLFQNILEDELKNEKKIKENDKLAQQTEKFLNNQQQQQLNQDKQRQDIFDFQEVKKQNQELQNQDNSELSNIPYQQDLNVLMNQNYKNNSKNNNGEFSRLTFGQPENSNLNNQNSPNFKQLQNNKNNFQSPQKLQQLQGSPIYLQEKTENYQSPTQEQIEQQFKLKKHQRDRWNEIEGDIDERLKRKQERIEIYSRSRSKSKERMEPIINEMEQQNLWQNKQKRIQQFEEEDIETSFEKQQKILRKNQEITLKEFDDIINKYQN